MSLHACQQLVASSQQPAASSQQPAASDQQPTSSDPQTAANGNPLEAVPAAFVIRPRKNNPGDPNWFPISTQPGLAKCAE